MSSVSQRLPRRDVASVARIASNAASLAHAPDAARAPLGLTADAEGLRSRLRASDTGKLFASRLAPKAEPQVAARLASFVRQSAKDIERGYHLPRTYIDGYYERRILPYLPKVRYPEVESPDVLYRGMFVSAEDLATMLEGGFPVSRNSWTAAGGKGIYFSTSEQEAKTYVFQNGSDAFEGLGVVFKVRRTEAMQPVERSDLNPTGTIYKSAEDVPPGPILDVYLVGEYGLESLDEIRSKIAQGKLRDHESWTGAFDSLFGR